MSPLDAAQVWLIVGLGNPGPRYAANRHNVGQHVLDALAERHGATFRSGKRAQVADVRIGHLPGGAPGPRAVLIKPGTYMNVSGPPVAHLAAGLDPSQILVIHDELDLPPHTLRLKQGGGEGGHNGLRSITSALGTRDYVRLRVGIGRPPGSQDAADFVLSNFPASQREEWATTVQLAADVVDDLAQRGLDKARMTLHTNT